MISYILMFASVPLLGYGIKPYTWDNIYTIIYTILALQCGFYAALIWNDINDKKIDKIVHPNRPIPSGRITEKKFFIIALIFSLMTFLFSYLVSFRCLVFVGFGALFVAIHDKYLKKKINIPAYSEIFTPLQWTIVPLFAYFAVNGLALQTIILLVLFTYFSDGAHDIFEGIHDVKGDKKIGIKTYSTSFGVMFAKNFSIFMVMVSGIIGIVLYITTSLTLIFLIPFLVSWTYVIYSTLRLKFGTTNEKIMYDSALNTGQLIYKYFLFTYDLIFIDMLLQIINTNIV